MGVGIGERDYGWLGERRRRHAGRMNRPNGACHGGGLWGQEREVGVEESREEEDKSKM